jgi:hypothetical protein
MTELNLTQAVEKLALTTCDLTDDDLDREWNWRAYSEGVRYAMFRTYEELRTLAAVLIAERTTKGAPVSTAHHALAQYHTAYRDLQSILIGLDEGLINASPAPNEWPLRIILGHILSAEREFFARIWHAVHQYRNIDSLKKTAPHSNQPQNYALENESFIDEDEPIEEPESSVPEPVEMTAEEVAEFVGSYEDFERTMNRLSIPGVMAFYDSLHKRVLRELTDIKGFELEAESLWWEGTPFTVEFRLHRLDAHLRQHTVQIEKTLDTLGYPPSESRRLLRLIYAALADVDSAIIGDWGMGKAERRELAGKIAVRADEIRAIFRP